MLRSTRPLLNAAVRVRFAPSPTGFLHLGNLRTALFNHFLARKHADSKFIVRIEDTDRNRFVPDAIEQITHALKWAGVRVDEGIGAKDVGSNGPYTQSERTAIYQEHAQKLLDCGHAYRCFCTVKELTEIRTQQKAIGSVLPYDGRCAALSESQVASRLASNTPHCIRLKVPRINDTGEFKTTEFKDQVHGFMQFQNKIIDDQILLKPDGLPTYHLSNVVDDHLMKITHVIRGQEWLTSTPKHIILYNAFGWKEPTFVHLPLLMNADGTKLSKRNDAANVQEFIRQGYMPEALMNFLALSGWHTELKDSAAEILTEHQIIERFELADISKTGAIIVDTQKLRLFNREHLKMKASKPEGMHELVTELRQRIHEASLENVDAPIDLDSYLSRVITALQMVPLLSEMVSDAIYFYRPPEYDVKDLPDNSDSILNSLKQMIDCDSNDDDITRDQFSFILSQIPKEFKNSTSKAVKRVIRYGITGQKVGASLADVAAILGRKRLLTRINSCLEELKNTTR